MCTQHQECMSNPAEIETLVTSIMMTPRQSTIQTVGTRSQNRKGMEERLFRGTYLAEQASALAYEANKSLRTMEKKTCAHNPRKRKV